MTSSTAPPILPVSTPQLNTKTTAAGAPTSAGPVPPPSAFRAFVSRLHSQINDGLSQRRPWVELLDRAAFVKPESVSDATQRLRRNYSYFRVNYLTFLAGILALSLLTHPFSLLTLCALLAAWCFLYLLRPSDQPLVLFGRSFSDKETLGLLVIFSVFVIFLTSVGSLLMSALVIGITMVIAHGSFRIPEDLFLDDQEPGGTTTGFLSFLGGATTNVAVAAAPIVAPRI